MFTQSACLALVLTATLALTVEARTFTVYNNCNGLTLWPALFTSGGDRPNHPTGWKADPYTKVTIDVHENWNGRIWARRDCNFAGGSTLPQTCASGGCNGGLECAFVGGTGVPPVSLAEFNLNDANQDWYDISFVDGYNVPLAIYPSATSCKAPVCNQDLNPSCPNELRGKNNDGVTVGCKSDCFATGNPAACCAGPNHDRPATCPNSGVPHYSYFKSACPNAYAYAYDESSESALWTCPRSQHTDYTITFCP